MVASTPLHKNDLTLVTDGQRGNSGVQFRSRPQSANLSITADSISTHVELIRGRTSSSVVEHEPVGTVPPIGFHFD